MPGSGFEADTGARTASALEGIACEIEVNSPRSLDQDDIAGPEVRLQVRGDLAGFFEIIQAFRRKARVAGSAPDLAGKRADALTQYRAVLARPNVYDAHEQAQAGLKEAFKKKLS